MATVRITQVRSIIGRPESQKRTMKALGLGKISQYCDKEVSDSMSGMIRKINHLVKVEEI